MPNKKYKLIAFDIDGTILTDKHKVCKRLIAVVAKLRQQGYLFTLATARFPLSALRIARELGLDDVNSIITLNGGFITNQKHNVVYTNTFNTHIFKQNLATINEDLITINYYNGFNWLINKYTKFTEIELKYIAIPYIPKLGVLDMVNKITLNGENLDLIEIKTNLAKHTNLQVVFSHPNYLEIMAHDISKWYGVSHLARELNINVNEIIAFGDGENDIPMLTKVGLGVAMDNASDSVKFVASDVAGHHLDAGVAIYLENLVKLGVL